MKKQEEILFIIGTRPEAIKLAPLIKTFINDNSFNVSVCLTAQHRELVDEVIEFFEIKVDYDLDLMSENQNSLQFISKAIIALEEVVNNVKPNLLVVQGDTSTVLVGSLVGFYQKIKVIHIEAGLRSFNLQAPFPEEMNRILSSKLSNYHFAPTLKAVENLANEGIQDNVHLVGNTVVDALKYVSDKLKTENINYYNEFNELNFDKKLILVSCHRRENFGKPLQNICEALNELAIKHYDIEIVMLVHPNPNVKKTIDKVLNRKKVITVFPLSYPKLVWMMKQSYFILTDSGGIQEEAPSLGKPVLVLRDVTERIEGIDAGTAILIGTSKESIVKEVTNLLEKNSLYKKMATVKNPYGNGNSSEKILKSLKNGITSYSL